jgi:hypothetical protein
MALISEEALAVLLVDWAIIDWPEVLGIAVGQPEAHGDGKLLKKPSGRANDQQI